MLYYAFLEYHNFVIKYQEGARLIGSNQMMPLFRSLSAVYLHRLVIFEMISAENMIHELIRWFIQCALISLLFSVPVKQGVSITPLTQF